MAKKKDSAAIPVQAGNCSKCGKHNIVAKYFKNEDGTITQTITCQDCGYIVSEVGENRYRAARNALTVWGFSEGYGPSKPVKEKPAVVEVKKPVELASEPVEEKELDEEVEEAPVVEKKEIKKKVPLKDKKKAEEEKIKNDKHVVLTKDKAALLRDLKKVIDTFIKENPKEECPVTLGDLMKVYGFTNEEIVSEINKSVKHKKLFLHSKQDVLYWLNKGQSVFTKDRDGVVYKYTPIRKMEDDQQSAYILDAIGIANYAYVLVDN